MSRSNKSRNRRKRGRRKYTYNDDMKAVSYRVISGRGSYHYKKTYKTWPKRNGNKRARHEVRQKLRVVRESAFESFATVITADRLEEKGHLQNAEKLRNRNDPDLPIRHAELWDRWWYVD